MSARAAVTAIFALNGAMFASLFSRLPAIRHELDLSEGQIGLALFCAMIGLIASQPVAGALVSRRGSRPIVLAGVLGYSLGLVPVAFAPSFGLFAAAFVLIGFGSGTLDVSMNVQGITVERNAGRPILSSMHAAFSFGALGGAAVGSAMARADVDYRAHLSGVAAVAVLVGVALCLRLLPAGMDAEPEGSRFARPSRALLGLGLLAFCVLLSEGSVGDWSAVLLDGELGADQGTAALGLAAFSLAMGIGRLLVDRVVESVGTRRMVETGGLIAAAGLGAGLLSGEPAVAIAGLAVMGIGLAGLFPSTVRAAAESQAVAGPAVAAVSATGYVGFVAGPPIIGALAQATSLRVALALVVAMCVGAALLGRELP